MEGLTRNPPVLLLAAALALGIVTTLALTGGMTFYQDTWAFLMERQHLSTQSLFRPHNEHLVVFPVLIEMLLVHTFGMSSALPEYVALSLFLAATALLLYIYLRRRIGPWLALLGVAIVLWLGPAWEALLWPFEITFVGPILFGLAMLLALERGDRMGDIAACVFLTLAIGFSGAGICFIAGAAVAVLQDPRRSRLRRAYVFVVPLLLYAAWWIGWGKDVESHVSLHNLLMSPRFVADSVAWALQSALGLAPSPSEGTDVSWGRALVVVAALALALAYRRRRSWLRIEAGLWPILATALVNWFLTALNAMPGRDPAASRYQYAGVIFVLMIAANLIKGVRPGRMALIALAVVTALIVWSNFSSLEEGRDSLEAQTELTRADTAAIEIAAGAVAPEFQLVESVAGTPSLINITAGPYLRAVDEFGSPAYTPAELTRAPEAARRQADIVLSQALRLRTKLRLHAYGSRPSPHGCVLLPAGGSSASDVSLPFGLTKIEVAPGPRAGFNLRRFAVGGFPIATPGAPGDSVTLLRIPSDASNRPWHLHVEAPQRVRVCR